MIIIITLNSQKKIKKWYSKLIKLNKKLNLMRMNINNILKIPQKYMECHLIVNHY